MDALGDVVEEVGEAALRVRVGDDPERPPVGQVPPALLRLDGPVGGEQTGLPAAEIRLLGELAGGAQPIEDLAVRRGGFEKRLVEVPELAVGGVVEGEPLLSVEDRDRGRQLVERAGVRLHLALEVVADAIELRNVDGDAGAAGRGRALGHVEHAPGAGDDGGDPGRVGAAGGPPAGRFVAIGAVEQLEAAGPRVRRVRRLDGAKIGLVRPAEGAVAGAQPDRLRDGVEEPAQALELVLALGELAHQPHHLEPVAGHVAQAKQRAAGDGTALGLDEALAQRAQRQVEALAALAQLLERALERGRVHGREPGAEGERPAGVGGFADDGRVAFEGRLAVAAAPAHDELPLGADQHLGAVVGAAQACDLAVEGALAAAPAGALVQVQQRRRGREDGEPEEERRARWRCAGRAAAARRRARGPRP